MKNSLWKASSKTIKQTHVYHYLKWLKEKKNLKFKNYDFLWEWSVENFSDFWKTQIEYHNLLLHSPYKKVFSANKKNNIMIKNEWFPQATLNYAEHIFRNKNNENPAIIAQKEGQPTNKIKKVSWSELELLTTQIVAFFKKNKIEKGDLVVANITNEVPAVAIYLACASQGIIFSSCSPEFGAQTVIERFKILKPKVLFTIDQYQYNGKLFNQNKKNNKIKEKLPSLKKIVIIPDVKTNSPKKKSLEISWDKITKEKNPSVLEFIPLPFNYPLVVLFSSGTTGLPKAITHGHGGILIEHLKYLKFHNDLKEKEIFFWYTSTSWMMWNFLVSALLVKATIVLYQGSPTYKDPDTLWDLAQKISINHFGCNAAYLTFLYKEKIEIKKKYFLPKLRSIGSTGSPLTSEVFTWCYKKIKSNMWLFSISGGSDVCTAFVGGLPSGNIFPGEIQKRCLGAKVEVFNSKGKSIINKEGELVLTKPLPSMPIYFWGDKNKTKLIETYFSKYPHAWYHGDRARLTRKQSIIILGRSDAMLNRYGIKIGTGEVYNVLQKVNEITDSLILNIEMGQEKYYMPLFVQLKKNVQLSNSLIARIKNIIRSDCSPHHVPEEVITVPEIPYTLNGKKVEVPIKRIILGEKIEKTINLGLLKNPQSIDFFLKFKI